MRTSLRAAQALRMVSWPVHAFSLRWGGPGSQLEFGWVAAGPNRRVWASPPAGTHYKPFHAELLI
ncbi:exported hypothetical protein [Mesorhizobium escarrei]|uniref:Uncharacterized protein n=1 Tax=Mesorhizobium escarrei TaxID=666018 RepID=A0ABN8JZ64_9HYPH|nr:exported hypothetical protein [Mesorhizobium escarrei]